MQEEPGHVRKCFRTAFRPHGQPGMNSHCGRGHHRAPMHYRIRYSRHTESTANEDISLPLFLLRWRTDGTYTYMCCYPVPSSVNGTKATFNLPAVQDGKASGGADIMIATPVEHGPLAPVPDPEDHSGMSLDDASVQVLGS